MPAANYEVVTCNTFKFNVPFRNIGISPDKIVCPDKKAIQAIAAQLLHNVAESYHEMIIMDGEPRKSQSREDIEDVYGEMVDTALDILDDHIEDLHNKIREYLTNIKVATPVTAIRYSESGELVGFNMSINIQEKPKQAAVVDASTKEVAVAA